MKNFRPEVLEEYCKNVLTASGVDEGCARTVARSLLDAAVPGPDGGEFLDRFAQTYGLTRAEGKTDHVV